MRISSLSWLWSGCMVFFLGNGSVSEAQLLPPRTWQAGVEVGAAISAVVPSNSTIPYYDQRIGFRAGGYLQRRLPANFALRTGVLYTLRGMYYNPTVYPNRLDRYWDLHGINIPFMIVYNLSPRVHVALGVELNTIFNSNLKLQELPFFQFGPRGAVGFNWSTRLRIAAYYTHLLGRLLVSPGQSESYYNNVISGISISYRFTGPPHPALPPVPLPCPCD